MKSLPVVQRLSAHLPPDRVERALPDKKPLYTTAEAKAEAERCLYCADAPCIKACPTEIDIPTFIKKIATENVRGSARTILEQNILGYSCARVCPVEVLCVGSCVYTAWHRDPIQIGRLQRYATETAMSIEPSIDAKKGDAKRPLLTPKTQAHPKRVALIGAGPASLACAAVLALEGHHAVVFEKRAVAGGLNTTGIAPYKLHADDALHEVDFVQSLGVEIRTGVEVGRDVTGQSLLSEYDAVFIGVGLGSDSRLGIPGEDGPGVIGATQWIEHMKLDAKNGASPVGRVLVIGGGNTAIDVARECALLQTIAGGSANVSMVYRRSEASMSGYRHEMEGARKEGVQLLVNTLPVAFLRDASGSLRAMKAVRAENGVPVAGTEHEIPCDLVAVAIGQSKLETIAAQFPGVALDPRGCIIADARTGATGNPKVWSGGDCINGGKEVVNAVADGRNTARTLIASWERENATGRREGGKV